MKMESLTTTEEIDLNLELIIAFFRLIVKTGLQEDAGKVFKSVRDSRGMNEPGHFFLGIGPKPGSGEIMVFCIPIERWEDCYFAYEMHNARKPTIVDTGAYITHLNNLFA
jgi:hypothetical protein